MNSTAGPDLVAASIAGPLAATTAAPEEVTRTLRAVADAVEALGHPPSCRIEPFVPGRRSTTEERYPGLGSSDGAALLFADSRHRNNRCTILFRADDDHPDLSSDVTIHWSDDPTCTPLGGWDRRPVEPAVSDGMLAALHIDPEETFPSSELDFEHGYRREATLQLCVRWRGVAVSVATATIDVYDVARFGELYRRILDRVVAVDVERQASAWPGGAEIPEVIHHPWSPVLVIGMAKAALYTEAVVDDIVAKTSHLADPRWLLRVGVYLEMLTCLGIVEAVRDELGDVLTDSERAALGESDTWREVRGRIDPAAWRDVWAMRAIVQPRLGLPRAGPVSAVNLLQKKRATLAFLHAHHEDLRHAIELAGPNHRDAQESWQRVFRDAERAVLRNTSSAFPELNYLPSRMREVVLWQRQGVAGQQGLYPTACTQYRASMNDVAGWARDRGLMDYTGEECVPLGASLLQAIMQDPERVPVLESGDGYLDSGVAAAPGEHGEVRSDGMLSSFEELLAGVPMLSLLSAAERRVVAERSMPVFAAPGERIVVEGTVGDSLYVVAEGEVEVIVRVDGRDRHVDTMGRGAVFGEMTLLTGEPRSATIRTIDAALVLEIGRAQYESLLRAHPEWVDELASMMEDRLAERRLRLSRGDSPAKRRGRPRRSTRRLRAQIASRFSVDV